MEFGGHKSVCRRSRRIGRRLRPHRGPDANPAGASGRKARSTGTLPCPEPGRGLEEVARNRSGLTSGGREQRGCHCELKDPGPELRAGRGVLTRWELRTRKSQTMSPSSALAWFPVTCSSTCPSPAPGLLRLFLSLLFPWHQILKRLLGLSRLV